jgi:hypothetical protein
MNSHVHDQDIIRGKKAKFKCSCEDILRTMAKTTRSMVARGWAEQEQGDTGTLGQWMLL